MISIRQNYNAELNYGDIVKKLKVELEEYKKSLCIEHKEYVGEPKFGSTAFNAESDYMEFYLYRVNREKIKSMEKYLNFLEKIIDNQKYDHVEKWLTWVIKYRNFIYHNWRNY